MIRLNYKHLYYFWVVAKYGSIARASEALHLTPPTLSSQIAALEDTLGVKLFQKQGRQLTVTETGSATFEYAEEIFSLGMELENFLKNNHQHRQTIFKVGVADVMPKLMVYRLLAPGYSLSEDLRVVCHESTFETLLNDLAAHKLDLIIADRRVDPDSNIKAYNHALGTSGITFFAQKSQYGKLKKDFPHSLQNAEMLLPTVNTALRRSIDQWFEEMDITPFIVGEFDDSALLKVFGQAGVGIFCAPTVIETEILAQYDVKPIGQTNAIEEKYYAITAERRIKHPMVVHLREMATKLFEAD